VKESFRVQRVEKELQTLLSEYFAKNLRFSALTSVLRVESNKELRAAKVFVSVLGSDEQRETVMERLDQEVYTIQGFLNREMRMKYVPRIRFVLDKGLDHMAHVQDVISNLKSDEEE
jgi:ribosome-binding factor A